MNYSDIINAAGHREYPLPKGYWLMAQHWEHILFLHFPVAASVLAGQLPSGLELDTYEGEAWVSIIPFFVRKMHIRKMPPIPFTSKFLELNIRTYVKRNGIKGVYFFSLDANKILPVIGARIMTLPYYRSDIYAVRSDDALEFLSRRRGSVPCEFQARFKSAGPGHYPERGSLEYWLAERYFLYTIQNRSLYCGGIHHMPWKLRHADVQIQKLSCIPLTEIEINHSNYLASYTKEKTALIWPMHKIC